MRVNSDRLLKEALTREQVFFDGRAMVVCYKLKNGFVIVGKSLCSRPEDFDEDFSRESCRRDALKQLNLLECYLLQSKISQKY